MKIKRLVAVLTAATLVLGCGITALADSTATGTGTYEGDKPKPPTVSITLPTNDQIKDTYSYIADPNDLIHITSGAAYGGIDVDEFNNDDNGYVYFKNGENLYSNNSDSIEIVSQNMADVEVTMKAEVKTAADGVHLADTIDFKDKQGVVSEDNLVFLGIVTSGAAGGRAKAEPVLDDEAAEVTVKIEGVEDNYEITYDTTGKKYQYSPVGGADLDDLEWNSTELYLAGAINTKAKWQGVNTKCPDITVTWSYSEVKAEPTVNGKTADDAKQTIHYTSGKDLKIPYSLGSGTTKAKALDRITYVNASGVSTKLDAQFWEKTEGFIIIKSDYITNMANASLTRDYKVTFVKDDGTTTHTQITITLAP
jgi:hypothetical protein